MPTRLELLGPLRRPLAVFALAALTGAPCAILLPAQAPAVTRRDLADAYLEVDRAAMRLGIPDEQRAAWNRDFDRTTLAFFGGDFPKVLRDMHDLLARMTGDSASGSATRQLLALRVRAEPRVLVAGRNTQVNITATVLYDDPAIRQARRLAVRIRDSQGRELIGGTLTVPPQAAAGQIVTLQLDPSMLIGAPGRYTVDAVLEGAQLQRVTELFVLPEPAAAIRARLARELDAAPDTADAQAVASARARIELIVEQPSEVNSAQFTADPAALTRALESEIRALARGQNPYELKVGDTWRVIVGPEGPIPVRIYAPRSVAMGARMPVVVALHGAGGDENMFLEGYGNGRLRAYADSLDFILVSPATSAFARNPVALDSALAVLEREYVIDRSTVYVLGHSMGGAAAIRIASERPDMVRAVGVIAGVGALAPGRSSPPTFFLGAQVDLIIPAARVRAAFERFRAQGIVAEYAEARDWGHTLVVGARLDDIVHWLFNH